MIPTTSKFNQLFRRLSSNVKIFYTKNHEWLKVIENKLLTCDMSNLIKAQVGITDYSQRALGDIIFVDLPKINTKYQIEGK